MLLCDEEVSPREVGSTGIRTSVFLVLTTIPIFPLGSHRHGSHVYMLDVSSADAICRFVLGRIWSCVGLQVQASHIPQVAGND